MENKFNILFEDKNDVLFEEAVRFYSFPIPDMLKQ